MESRPECFAAYVSNLPGMGDEIEAALSEFNQGGIGPASGLLS
jgi:hypothetical protein